MEDNSAKSDIVNYLEDKKPSGEWGNFVDVLSKKKELIDVRLANVAADLSKEVQNKVGSGVSLVLMGSGVHGGAVARHISGTTAKDFDCGMVFSPDTKNTEELSKKVSKIIKENVSQLAKKYGVQNSENFKLCTKINPETVHMPNIENADSFAKKLHHDFRNGFINELTNIYFCPSFPPSVNRQNQEFVLEALSKLSRKDRNAWKQITTRLIDSWRLTSAIQTKHLGISEEEEGWEIKIDPQFRQIIMEPFVKMINATDKSKK